MSRGAFRRVYFFVVNLLCGRASLMYKQVYKNGHAEIDRFEKSLRKIKEMMKTEL